MNIKDWAKENGAEVFTLDVGRRVFCDMSCDKEWTDSKKSGGFLFGSKAVCPECEDRILKSINGYGEESHIKGYCPGNESFADWVRSMRSF